MDCKAIHPSLLPFFRFKIGRVLTLLFVSLHLSLSSLSFYLLPCSQPLSADTSLMVKGRRLCAEAAFPQHHTPIGLSTTSKETSGSSDNCMVVETLDSPNHSMGRVHSSNRNGYRGSLVVKGGGLSAEVALPQDKKSNGTTMTSRISTRSSNQYTYPGTNWKVRFDLQKEKNLLLHSKIRTRTFLLTTNLSTQKIMFLPIPKNNSSVVLSANGIMKKEKNRKI